FTKPQEEEVLRRWEKDRKGALKVFQTAMRNVEINHGMKATADVNNYFLVNSLYLRDDVSDKVAGIIRGLNELVGHAMYWDNDRSAKEVDRLKKDSSERIEVLKRVLRGDLEAGGEGARGG